MLHDISQSISINNKHIENKFLQIFTVSGPFVQTFCIEKDSHIDAI